MHTIHNRVTDLFEGLAFAAKTILDPIIEMLTMFIKQSPDPTVKNVSSTHMKHKKEHKLEVRTMIMLQNELLEKLQERSKLWGLVVAQLVNQNLGNIEIPQPVHYTIHTIIKNALHTQFTVGFRLPFKRLLEPLHRDAVQRRAAQLQRGRGPRRILVQ